MGRAGCGAWSCELLWSSIISSSFPSNLQHLQQDQVLFVQRFPNPLSTQMPEEQPGVTGDSRGMQQVDVALNFSWICPLLL
ncbi:hypothetical protein EK904_014474 [Melospiza melodia maxima]|nr:hypothetical protein EK904_014474 [Melospiza melodia maxima]